MDWQGQKLAEQLMQIMLVAVAVAAYVTGFMIESFRVMTLIYAGGVVLITLITVPNWPLFNRHPLKWLEPSVAEGYSKEPPQQQAVGLERRNPRRSRACNGGICEQPVLLIGACAEIH